MEARETDLSGIALNQTNFHTKFFEIVVCKLAFLWLGLTVLNLSHVGDCGLLYPVQIFLTSHVSVVFTLWPAANCESH